MAKGDTIWDPAEDIQNEEHARYYLEGCIEEDPGDGSLIRAALSDIARAQNMTHLAKAAGITRMGLYKALSPDGNPSFATVLRIARALGVDWRLNVEDVTVSEHAHTS